MIKQSRLNYAQRKALQMFDDWNDVTGFVTPFTSYYDELCGIIEDVVKIGMLSALELPFKIKDGELIDE